LRGCNLQWLLSIRCGGLNGWQFHNTVFGELMALRTLGTRATVTAVAVT
jgi:hypothetical protein